MRNFHVTGMSCAACSARVEKAVRGVPGVTDCAVNLLTGGMQVEGGGDAAIISAVRAAGYDIKDAPRDDKKEKNGEISAMGKRLIVSLCFLLPLMYLSMGHTMWGWPLPRFFETAPLRIAAAQMLLAIAIMIANRKFFISGTKGLFHGAPNMDTLVSLGSGAAFLYSTAALFAAMDAPRDHTVLHGLYFESAGMILTLITVGKLLEAYSKGKTTKELGALMDLAPAAALVVREGKEIVIPPDQMRVGDLFIVRAGESVPTDGVVVEGAGAVDESALTGESVPVDKTEGDTVSAGTINRSGWLKCRAERVGGDTTLGRIIKMVSDAAGSKAPVAKAADRVAAVFVPVVMAIAAVTFIVWLLTGAGFSFALARGISVLVISCPCALGLATPVAIMAGSGVGAKNGILFKTAEVLEKAGKIEIAVFDKTGTVTTGHPGVTDVLSADGIAKEELTRLAASLESKSEHPLARAVVEANGAPTVGTEEFETFPGGGVSGRTEDKSLAGGNLAFIRRYCDIDETTVEAAETLAKQGKTPLYFAADGRFIGLIAVADTLKEDSAAAFAALRKKGIRTVLLTGDHHAAAETVGKAVGADEVISEVLPEQKAAAVEKLKENGRVAMVGDGVNDAPALAAADIGVAVGNGTDVAMDTADIVLTRGALSDLPRAVTLSKATLRNIYENLFWAFFYNACGIPLAAGAFIVWPGWTIGPMFGAAAMSLSSFFVVTNALRLNFVRLDTIKKAADAAKTERKEETVMKKTVKIEGMMCLHCEANVQAALEALDGVQSAVVSHEDGTAVLTLSGNVPEAEIRAAVEEKGYKYLG